MGLSRASLWKETKVLFHPYYWINIILCASFVFMRLVSPFCQILFGPGKEACELDMRENEILFFLLVIVMVKSRKSGATATAAAYLASGFIYAKVWKWRRNEEWYKNCNFSGGQFDSLLSCGSTNGSRLLGGFFDPSNATARTDLQRPRKSSLFPCYWPGWWAQKGP